MGHPLHQAVADAIAAHVPQHSELLRDPACGGDQHLPLFVGAKKSRATRMCCVDLLILKEGKVRAIVEIEESGFLPTKICGKFFQAALANHFIHDSHTEGAIAFGPEVLFMQILDASACVKSGSVKELQGQLICKEIASLLPIRALTQYELFFVDGPEDHRQLTCVGDVVARALA